MFGLTATGKSTWSCHDLHMDWRDGEETDITATLLSPSGLEIAFGTLTTTFGLYLASLLLNWAIGFFGFAGPADVAALPALMIILGAYGLVTMPLENAISRWRESMADDYALQSTGKTDAFASAFTRLANQNLGEVDPEKWVVFLFYSHPPLGQRIEKARNWR